MMKAGRFCSEFDPGFGCRRAGIFLFIVFPETLVRRISLYGFCTGVLYMFSYRSCKILHDVAKRTAAKPTRY